MSVLRVLYEDNHCLAAAKPGGLLTQGVPPGIPTLEAQVKAYLKDRYHKPGRVYLGIPHRLDRPVSGVVLFARNTKAARRLAEQFQKHQVTKIYWAAVGKRDVRAGPETTGQELQVSTLALQLDSDVSFPEAGTWEDWLLKLPEEARSEVVQPDTPGARRAILHFRRLQFLSDGALVEIRPETGRMHQIRVQAARRGWPIRGDLLYGSMQAFGPPTDLARDRVIALHGRSLTFLHPIRYEPVTVVAPLPETWQSLAIEYE